jgi:hypothetical protein
LSEKVAFAKKLSPMLMNAILIFIIALSSFNIIMTDSRRFGSVYEPGFGVNRNFYPLDAVDFVEGNDIRGNMFNNYGFGGYLIWRFYPERRVFIDGRFDAYGEEFVAAYRRFPFKSVWDHLVRKYNFTFVLLDNEPSYICRNLDNDDEWILVFWDDRSLVYVRDLPQNRSVIDKYAYMHLRPNDRDFNYLNEYINSPKFDEVIYELKRSFDDGRESLNARLMLAHMYERKDGLEFYRSAVAELEALIDALPDWGDLYRRLGVLHMRYRNFEEARKIMKISEGK